MSGQQHAGCQLDAFLRDFIGLGQDQVTNLDLEWEPHNEGLNAAYATHTLAGSPVLVYKASDGVLRSKPLTEDAYRHCREALIADIQELGSSSSSDRSPRYSQRRRPAQLVLVGNAHQDE
jgi:hypothetical protein